MSNFCIPVLKIEDFENVNLSEDFSSVKIEKFFAWFVAFWNKSVFTSTQYVFVVVAERFPNPFISSSTRFTIFSYRILSPQKNITYFYFNVKAEQNLKISVWLRVEECVREQHFFSIFCSNLVHWNAHIYHLFAKFFPVFSHQKEIWWNAYTFTY